MVLRLFQVSKAPNGDLRPSLGQGTSPLYPCDPFPYLFYVHLRFTGPTYIAYYFSPETSDLESLCDDLPRIADELSRIEREYEGAVELSVFRSMEFGKLDKLNVRFPFL